MSELDKDLRSIQEARSLIKHAKEAQKIYSGFSQEKIDQIIEYVAKGVLVYAEELAKLANEETGFGKWEDKVVKNIVAAKILADYIRPMKTVGILREDKVNRIIEVGVPLGVICALVPSTNPTSTIIYKTLIALKSGNAIIFSPHPNAVRCSNRAIEILKKLIKEAGAPDGIMNGLTVLTLQATQELMKHKDTSLILATGGEAMVKAAYQSGTPTISGGPGNGPAFIEKSANVKKAVKDIIVSKTFDNGVICASEQSIIIEAGLLTEVVQELVINKAYFMNEQESDAAAKILMRENGTPNPVVVGKSAVKVAELAGFAVPQDTTVLLSIQDTVSKSNPYSREKLCPVLAVYVASDWQQACQRIHELLQNEGKGHTFTVHSQDEEIVKAFALEKPVYRMLVNTPATLGGIGVTTNLAPALTLGCGAAGGGSSADNVNPLHLINIRKVAYEVKGFDEINKEIAQMRQQIGLTARGDSSCSTGNCSNVLGSLPPGAKIKVNEGDVLSTIKSILSK